MLGQISLQSRIYDIIIICLISNTNRSILRVSEQNCILSPFKKSLHIVIEGEAKNYETPHAPAIYKLQNF